jgi:hypothetical protein
MSPSTEETDWQLTAAKAARKIEEDRQIIERLQAQVSDLSQALALTKELLEVRFSERAELRVLIQHLADTLRLAAVRSETTNLILARELRDEATKALGCIAAD